ncbi:MAG: hypothetical protein MZV70_77605 [Desulfobacterales bacterium]|nr:hypothetical protein [Desulfobacterales bacterium]
MIATIHQHERPKRSSPPFRAIEPAGWGWSDLPGNREYPRGGYIIGSTRSGPARGSGRRVHPAEASEGAPVFQEIKLTSAPPSIERWAAEVRLPTGMAVRFSPGASAQWIGSVVQALQRPC